MPAVRSAAAFGFVAGAMALLSLSGLAHAANTTFTNEGSFVAAAGSTVVESFEALAGRSRVLSPVVTPLLTATPGTAPLGVQTAPDTPDNGFGAAATDGTHYLSIYLPNAAQGTLRFDLGSPSKVFGFNIIDVGEATGTVTLRTNAGAFAGGVTLLSFPPTFGNGAVFFIGLTQDIAFTTVFLDVSGLDDAYGIDKVYIQAVPETASAWSLLAGLAALGLRARRRHR